MIRKFALTIERILPIKKILYLISLPLSIHFSKKSLHFRGDYITKPDVNGAPWNRKFPGWPLSGDSRETRFFGHREFLGSRGKIAMLDLMRKHARNWLMKIILGIIIVVFIFYCGSRGGRQRAERIAVIDGKPIVYVDFQREHQNLIELYRQRLGQGLTEEILKSLNLKQQALDNLINQAVILEKAEELNVQVTDQDVKAAILSYPAFQRTGAFNA